jgi:hypothetical protein
MKFYNSAFYGVDGVYKYMCFYLSCLFKGVFDTGANHQLAKNPEGLMDGLIFS